MNRSKLSFCIALLAGTAGCAETDTPQIDDSTSSPATESVESDVLAQISAGNTKTVRDPNGVYIANVTASGPGCKPGTWSVAIAKDGEVFNLAFDDYQVQASQSDASSILSTTCKLKVSIDSPPNLMWAVYDFGYSGYANFPIGVTGGVATRYSWDGIATTTNKETSRPILPPHDGSFVLNDQVSVYDWSPCGAARALGIDTRLSITNTPIKQAAYINISSIDAQKKGLFHFRLRSRKC